MKNRQLRCLLPKEVDEIINRARIHLLEKEKRRKIRGQKRREEPGMTQGALGFTINF